MHVYLRDSPRAIVLVSSGDGAPLGPSPSVPKKEWALVFKPAQREGVGSGASTALSSQALVEFVSAHDLDLQSMVRLSQRPVFGCLGLINVGQDLFVALVSSAIHIGSIRPHESVSRILSVDFYCLNKSIWDDNAIDVILGSTLSPTDAMDIQSDAVLQPGIYEHPCAPLKKLLSSGTFYYASEGFFDLSSRLEKQVGIEKHDMGTYDFRFVWNSYLIDSLLQFRNNLEADEREELDRQNFLILAIQGFVGVFDLSYDRSRPPTTLAVVSRLSWKRAGTRFNTRGIDDEGNVANFVETETIFSTEDICFSYVQVRGSVPLFWEQQGLQTFNQRIQITRPRLASQPAFDRHFADLTSRYYQVNALNLLGTRESEAILMGAYAEHLHASPFADDAEGGEAGKATFTHFDFHMNARNTGGLDGVRAELRRMPEIRSFAEHCGYTLADQKVGTMVLAQEGIFRTNCLDCLDRTNVVQDVLSQFTLENFLSNSLGQGSDVFLAGGSSMWSSHRVLWAENGDALSRIYAGTGALNTSFTRSGKRTLGGLLSDATKSMGRMYINNFQDKNKQNVIDMLLGNLANQRPVTIFDPLHDAVRSQLANRLGEYSSSRPISIFVGTFNLNGKRPGESLVPWLFPVPDAPEPDIMALGFQEIVQLTPQQIVLTDPEKKRLWESVILDTLARRPDKKSDYLIIRSDQLVGTALIVLVKKELSGCIRNVEAATKKTGLRGMSGNKGAVAVRLDYFDTSFCFVTAHLAAGHSNVEERNADYWTIANGLQFLRGKNIMGHDNTIWLGDFNYRIDLSRSEAEALALEDGYDALFAADQLHRAVENNEAFVGYEEGPLLFRPTYKYDDGLDSYDTGEKQRVPAWTDRILYRGSTISLRKYSRAELKTSDHRPVFALFDSEVRIMDEERRSALSKTLFEQVAAGAPLEMAEEKMTEMQNGESDGLPPPSDDTRMWWEVPGHPNGVFVDSEVLDQRANGTSRNPFDDEADEAHSSPPQKRKPPQPPRSLKPSASTSSLGTPPRQRGDPQNVASLSPPTALLQGSRSVPSTPPPGMIPPAVPARPNFTRSVSYQSQRSLIDSSDSDQDSARINDIKVITPDKP